MVTNACPDQVCLGMQTFHLDLAIQLPGGVGGGQDVCKKYSDAKYPGQNYFTMTSSKSNPNCNNLPEPLQEGCQDYYDTMSAFDNPHVNWEQVACPQVLLDKFEQNHDCPFDQPLPTSPDGYTYSNCVLGSDLTQLDEGCRECPGGSKCKYYGSWSTCDKDEL